MNNSVIFILSCQGLEVSHAQGLGSLLWELKEFLLSRSTSFKQWPILISKHSFLVAFCL